MCEAHLHEVHLSKAFFMLAFGGYEYSSNELLYKYAFGNFNVRPGGVQYMVLACPYCVLAWAGGPSDVGGP